uniref:Protein ABCI7, chloroplastic n=1 Tax=Nelumbo nucifera TaxID=4432 RepID=A0A822YQX5_NELNU|nr:TPA_asm: hypothetical protein HUJ06_005580 [Nelumbo nucifera]
MATVTFSPPFRFSPISSFPSKFRTRTRFIIPPLSSLTPRAALSDPFVLEIAQTLEDSVSTPSPSSLPPPPLQKLRDTSSESILSMSWPTRKDEPFRFIDTSFIKQSRIHPIPIPSPSSDLAGISSDTQFPSLVIVDGHIVPSASQLSGFPDGVYVGSISGISSEAIMEKVLQLVSDFHDGDLFWSLNGIGAPDVTVIFVPAGCQVEKPLHLRFYSREGGEIGSNYMPLSSPRVLVLVEKGGEIGIIEEYSGGDADKCYWANSVIQLALEEEAKIHHSYIQAQTASAAHIKWTFVRQESSSNYELVEISAGGKLSRHNLHVQQVGPDTITELSAFHLSVSDQTQDLHSRLVLDHPRGYSRQLHKSIVAHSSGQAVFDGNIKICTTDRCWAVDKKPPT